MSTLGVSSFRRFPQPVLPHGSAPPPRSRSAFKKAFPDIFPHGQINERILERVAGGIKPDREWKFVHVGDPAEIDRLIALRKRTFGKMGIGGGRDAFDGNHTRYFALYYRDPGDESWHLSKSLRITRASGDELPIDRDLNVSLDQEATAGGLLPMCSEERERAHRLMNTFPKNRQFQVGGFFSAPAAGDSETKSKKKLRSLLFEESLYRLVHGACRLLLQCRAALILHTQCRSHAKWYRNCSGAPYHVLAGEEKPYADYAGREAVLVAMVQPTLREGLRQLLNHSVVERLVHDDMYCIDRDPWQEQVPARSLQEPARA